LVQCKSTFDMHAFRVHHNFKIDTSRFEEGNRPSHAVLIFIDGGRWRDAIQSALLPTHHLVFTCTRHWYAQDSPLN
jgi:hypothetical protein